MLNFSSTSYSFLLLCNSPGKLASDIEYACTQALCMEKKGLLLDYNMMVMEVDMLILANSSFLYYPDCPEDTTLMSLDGKIVSFVNGMSTVLSESSRSK